MKKNKTECPAEMPFTVSDSKWAFEHHITIDVIAETEAMIDWAHGKGEMRADWEATRRNWWRTAQKRKDEKKGETHGRPYETKNEHITRVNRETAATVRKRILGSAGYSPDDDPHS